MPVCETTGDPLYAEAKEALTEDFDLYSEHCLKIVNTDAQLVNFELNLIQQHFQEIIRSQERMHRLKRFIVLKARRQGLSTYTCGRFMWLTSNRPHRNAVMVTHEPDATNFLFEIHKRFYANMPPMFKPETLYNNRKQLQFNNMKRTGLDSSILVGTAGKENFGSSQAIHYLHLSEVAKWPTHIASALLTSILQAVPPTEDSEVIFESTAYGVGGEFYDRFHECPNLYDVYLDDNLEPTLRCTNDNQKDQDNEYSAVFFPWFTFPHYRRDSSRLGPLTEEERELRQAYNLTEEHIAWRRWAIANLCGGDLTVFKQEYPANPTEAFVSTGRMVFNVEKLIQWRRENHCVEPVAKYEIQLASYGNFIQSDTGRFRVWEEPKVGSEYIIGADVAEGILEHGDFSAAYVVNHITGQTVASWHGKIDPDEFGRLLCFIGQRYNGAWVIPERNNHGIATVTKMLDLGYSKLYAEIVVEPPQRTRKRYGWLTTRRSKEALMDNLVAELREGNINIIDVDLLNEMTTYKREENGEMSAERGKHDDRIMAFAIAKYMAKMLDPIQQTHRGESVTGVPTNVGSGQSSRYNLTGWF